MQDPSVTRPATSLQQSLPHQQAQAPAAPPYHGAVVQEKTLTSDGSSYLSTVGTYLADAGDFMSGYVPSALRKNLPSWSSAQPQVDEDRERPSWSGFDVCELPTGERRHVLCASYSTGFQVWDVGDGKGEMRELLSRREAYPIKCVRFLPQPAAREHPHHPFHGRRPMLVVLSSDENPTSAFANSMMKVYSAASGEYANMVKFSAEIQAVQASRRLVVVLLRAQLHAFDAVTMEQLFSFRTFPFSPLLAAPSVPCAALGPRFLAFASREPPPPGAAAAPSASALKDAATTVASGLAYLGEAGRRRVAEFLYPPPQHEIASTSPDESTPALETDAAGTVQVLDVLTRRVVTHFKAHTQPLSGMSWDPSGTLLVTVSNEAHHFHVWLITPAPAHLSPPPSPSSPATHMHLYKLVRGRTGAAVQSLSWSRDSRWLAVSSGRGTTHVFALHPQGGLPSTVTHASELVADDHAAPGAPLAKPFVALNALARIKPQRNASASGGGAPASPAPTSPGSTAWDDDETLLPSPAGKSPAPPPFPVSSVLLPCGYLLLHGDGQLGKWAMSAHGPPPGSELDPRTLCVDVTALSGWDLARRRSWPELRALLPSVAAMHVPPSPASTHLVAGPGESSVTLWAEVELHTHAPPFRPIWAGPQFSLRATDMNDFLAPLSLLTATATDPSLTAPLPAPSSPLLPIAAAPQSQQPPASTTPSLPVVPASIPSTLSASPPAPADAAASSGGGAWNGAGAAAAAGGGGGRRKDKKKNKAAAAAAAAAAASPSPPAPSAPAPPSPSLLRLDEPARATELPLMKLNNESPVSPYASSQPRPVNDARSQSIMSAISTPLMAPQSQAHAAPSSYAPYAPMQAAAPPASQAWSPGSSPLAPPIIEFLRPAQPRP